MKAGDRVMIFEDPITEEIPEGPAHLVDYVTVERGVLPLLACDTERWTVRFDGDQSTHVRTIRVSKTTRKETR